LLKSLHNIRKLDFWVGRILVFRFRNTIQIINKVIKFKITLDSLLVLCKLNTDC